MCMSYRPAKRYEDVITVGKSSLSVFKIKMLVFRAGIHKMLVRIANREDPDQTASLDAAWSGSLCLSRPFRLATSV